MSCKEICQNGHFQGYGRENDLINCPVSAFQRLSYIVKKKKNG